MKRVLVTGGGGFIGLALTRVLCRQGVEVVVYGRHHYPKAQAAGAICLQGDICDLQSVKQAVSGCDTVFHVAAKAGIWGPFSAYYSTNVLGTVNVIAACKKQGVHHLVYTSTPSVIFDGQDLEGVDETAPYAQKPLCHYAATKIIAEQEVLRANCNCLKTTAIRPHLVWGPGDTNLIPRLVVRGRSGDLRVVGSGQNLVDIAYIDNVVHAHLLAAENLETDSTAAGLCFFIGQHEPVQLWDWINSLFEQIGVAPVKKSVSLTGARIIGSILEISHALCGLEQEPKMTRFLAEQLAMSHWFSKNQAEKILGYREQVTTDEGVKRLLMWLAKKKRKIDCTSS